MEYDFRQEGWVLGRRKNGCKLAGRFGGKEGWGGKNHPALIGKTGPSKVERDPFRLRRGKKEAASLP